MKRGFWFVSVVLAAALAGLVGNLHELALDAQTSAPVYLNTIYRSAPPTLANGQRGEVPIDDKGRLLVHDSITDTNWANAVSGSSPITVDVREIGNVAVAASKCDDPAKVTSKVVSETTSGDKQQVAIDGSKVIYVCRIVLNTSAGVTLVLKRGTGSACATSPTTLDTWIFTAATAEPWGIANTSAVQYKTAAGDALCINLNGAVTVNGSILYVQE